MKKILVLTLALSLTGCAGASQYRSPSGEVFETSEQMAALMIQRDIEIARQNTIKAAFEAADSPEDAVGAAVLATQNSVPVQRPKTLDERLLPWASLFAPYLANWVGGGTNTMGENGIMIDGTGNSVSVVSGNVMTESQAYTQMTPTTNQTWNTQTGTEESANDGAYTYQPDSLTEYVTTPTTDTTVTDTTTPVTN